MHKLAVGFCLSLLLVACESPPPAEPVEFETLAKASSFEAGCERHDDRLIRDAVAWESYWDQVHPGTAPERPAVDFASESVLVTCGPRPDPGHSAEITAVGVYEGSAIAKVTVTDHTPGPNCFNAAVVIFGHHAVRVERVLGDADFTHESLAGAPC